jgi:hypothetical protein
MAPGKLARRARLGEYVLASKFSDTDPFDPWRVGFVCQVIETWKPAPGIAKYLYVIGDADGTWKDNRMYRYCRRITAEEGDEWLRLYTATT